MWGYCSRAKKKKGKRGIENARISTIQTLTTSFYDSLNLTLFSSFLLPHLSRLSHSPFQSFCFHASLLNHIAQVISLSLSLFGNFLKLKLNYHIYMLNIIYVCVCGGWFSYSSECKIHNHPSHHLSTVLENCLHHRTIHLQWSSVGCGLDQCKLVLSVVGGIWTSLIQTPHMPFQPTRDVAMLIAILLDYIA